MSNLNYSDNDNNTNSSYLTTSGTLQEIPATKNSQNILVQANNPSYHNTTAVINHDNYLNQAKHKKLATTTTSGTGNPSSTNLPPMTSSYHSSSYQNNSSNVSYNTSNFAQNSGGFFPKNGHFFTIFKSVWIQNRLPNHH